MKLYLHSLCIFVALVAQERMVQQLLEGGSVRMNQLQAPAQEIQKRHRKLVLEKL